MPSCDPAVGGIRADCPGIFVSSSLGDDGHAGTRDAPLRTMAVAIQVARSGPQRLYACAETFAEAVSLPAGLEVWGGLDCTRSWAYVGEDAKTAIVPVPGLIPLRVVAGSGRATIADVRAEAASAVQAGGSSIAVLVETSAAADILRSDLRAGDGAHGVKGNSGGSVSASAGAPGAPGAPACSATTVSGGAGALSVCHGYTSAGGTGGIGGVDVGGPGTRGTPEPYMNPAGDGLGGAGWSTGMSCGHGMFGADGDPGAHGQGAVHTWGISELGWSGPAGEDGSAGRPGQGGGGGGGARAGAPFCGAALGGASGGGGGAGGCGGAGGKAGGAGGASLGVLTLGGDVTLRATSISTGRGGDGGDGGPGQEGGPGGIGGVAGARVNGSPLGCGGGSGGAGGKGGHGGGGAGGPSLGILFPFGASPLQDAAIRTGEAGKGGLGGEPSVPGSAGEDGVRADTLGVPPR
ncbi:EBNA-1 protein [Chondromyces apiculatus DSM 436]|uniref:EBNA-1 protein n=1 Tax=Chondromyces apiculatus DSM 436 TaxID=1192034 RepID=A0A017SXJ8_9BACT|nr:EBNA-1 protein [Chondromyces apiculatus DSM 436]